MKKKGSNSGKLYVGQKREDLHFSIQTTQSSQGSGTTNQNETDKTKRTTHKKKRTARLCEFSQDL